MKTEQIFKSTAGKAAILSYYDSVLDRWPIPYESLYVATSLGETHIIACGEKGHPALVLLHGSSANATMWVGDVSEYCQSFRVYALDIPGEPGKSAEARPDLNSDAYARWMGEVFDRLEIDKASLVGISLGGWLAIHFPSAHPQRVEKLVVLCPAGVGPQKMGFLFLAVVLSPFGNWGREQMLRRVYSGQQIHPEAVKYSLLIADQFRPRMQPIPIFSDEALKRLTMPVLLIAGKKDALLFSEKMVGRMKDLLPRLSAHLLPDQGHVLIGFAKQIHGFLTEGETSPLG